MKYYLLKALTEYLKQFTHIKHIHRDDNNIIKIEFSKENIIYFDMIKGDPKVFIKPYSEKIKKTFSAPFDVVLQKKFTNSKIEKIYLLNDDKILRIEVVSRSSYKKTITKLQFEFTGKNTNVIILDQNDIVLEALRHIDENKSSRIVKVGVKLEDIPLPSFKFEQKQCEDIEQILRDIYLKNEQQKLDIVKKQKIAQIKKQQKKIVNILKKLDDVEKLQYQSDMMYQKGNLILANIHNIKPYSKMVELVDFDGNKVEIKIDDRFSSISAFANDLFKKGKKLKQKVQNQYLEEKNLKLKIDFFNRLIKQVEQATTIDQIEFYIPKKEKKQTKTKKSQPYQSFFIDGYKLMLGRDERENIYLLQNSKASDYWFHLKDQPSSHLIVSNRKKTIPQHIIEEAAKICAKFSLDEGGVVEVDYTQRRNVKIQTRANVLYNPYSTIVVKI